MSLRTKTDSSSGLQCPLLPIQPVAIRSPQLKIAPIIIVFTVVLLSTGPKTAAEEIVAILDFKFIEETALTAAVICYGDDEDDCYQHAVHYVFEAKVDKVISGNLPDKRFLVLYGRHALKKKNYRNIVALLKKRDSNNPDEPRYQIAQWGKKRTMYCIDYLQDDDTGTGVLRNDQFELSCYDQDSDR